jgi:hypothetical protein
VPPPLDILPPELAEARLRVENGRLHRRRGASLARGSLGSVVESYRRFESRALRQLTHRVTVSAASGIARIVPDFAWVSGVAVVTRPRRVGTLSGSFRSLFGWFLYRLVTALILITTLCRL